MRTQVIYLEDNCGIKAGTRKNLRSDIARKMAKRGIVKELGSAPEKLKGGNSTKADKVNPEVKKTELTGDTETSLKDKKVAELREILKEKGGNPDGLKKAELIEAIEAI